MSDRADPLPSARFLRDYYEGKAGRLDEIALTYEHPNWYKRWFYRNRSAAVLAQLDPRPGETVLDVGTGPGYYGRLIVAAGGRVVPLDLSSSYVKQAMGDRLRGWGVCGDANVLPFRDAAFAKVLATEVIEHSLTPDRVVAEVARVLRWGGTAVMTSPSAASYMDRLYDLKRRIHGYSVNEHLWEFTPETFRELVARHLRVDSVSFANCLVPFPLDGLVMRSPSSFLPGLEALERLLRSGRGGSRWAWTVIVRGTKSP